MKRSFALCLMCIAFVFASGQMNSTKLNQLVENTLKTFDVPGISLGIIKDGKVVFADGFGVRSLKTRRKMDKNTLVGIASNSKGFTATALAMLADEGKLEWDDKVTKFIPEFQMYDPYVSKEITIRDLLTHRGGLGLGQGDLMFFPEGGSFSTNDIIHNVRYLKPASSFRTQLTYNNIMFIVAGEVIHRVSGLSWAEFIEQRILRPVGMTSSYGSYSRAKSVSNKIDAHAPVENNVVVAVPHDWNETANAAGGIMSNIVDMTTWADFLLKGFVTKKGVRLVSQKNANELWSLQIPSDLSANNPYDTNFYGYGMGWFLSDVKGHFQVQHTGGLIGTVTQFTLIPDLKLGIVVLTNQQSGAAFSTITNTIKDYYLGLKNRSWLKHYADLVSQQNAKFDKEKAVVYAKVASALKNPSTSINFEKIIGTYTDPWFGDVNISKANGKFRLNCSSSPRLRGEVLPYSSNTFVVKWDDRSYDADAFIIFNFDPLGKPESARMQAISSVTDFSFDFEDLDLKRKN